MQPAAKPKGKRRRGAKQVKAPAARAVARLRAVQALYQMEMSGGSSDYIIGEFRLHRMGAGQGDEELPEADQALFGRLVRGATAERDSLDARISGVIGGGLSFDRFEALLKTILRAGAYELSHDLNIPPEVTINEYVNLADAFLGDRETGLINAVLQRLAPAAADSVTQRDGEIPTG